MTAFRKPGLWVLLGFVCPMGWCANPDLRAYDQGIEDPQSESQELRLADLMLDVDVVGSLADLTLTARFENTSDDILEGRFTLSLLPAGESVPREIVLRIAGLSGQTQVRRYQPGLARRDAFDPAGALWASERITLLAAEEGAGEELVQLSRRFSVASPQLSFLVLESPRDYVEADIGPPPGYPSERLEAYHEARRERDEEQREYREGRLGDLIENWQELITWWETPFDPQASKPEPKKASGPGALPATAAAAPADANQREAAVVVDSITAEDIGHFVDEVTVTGALAQLNSSVDVRLSAARANDIVIGLEKWSVDRPYVHALDAAAPADVDRVLEAQQQQFGGLPVFWFDVAEWLRLHGRELDSEEFLLSALELPIANEETVAMVAERLMRHGGVDRAVCLLERAARGEYRISVNVYNADVINPNGSTVVTARLYRDFGRPGQSVQTLEIELSPDAEGERRVGSFIVK